MKPEVNSKARKPYTITKSRESWTDTEHDQFLEAITLCVSPSRLPPRTTRLHYPLKCSRAAVRTPKIRPRWADGAYGVRAEPLYGTPPTRAEVNPTRPTLPVPAGMTATGRRLSRSSGPSPSSRCAIGVYVPTQPEASSHVADGHASFQR
jgi:hypothetical protein